MIAFLFTLSEKFVIAESINYFLNIKKY